jgi:sec-independent protein translocase protein TatA
MGLDNPLHIIFLLVVLLLIFGAKRIPEIARSVGQGMNEFKDAVSGNNKPSINAATEQPVAQPAPAPAQAAAPAPAPVATQAETAFAQRDEPQPEPQHQA